MNRAFQRIMVSLFAMATLLLITPSAQARGWKFWERGAPKDLVGMDVKAKHSGVIGKVDKVTLAPDGKIQDVTIGLNGANHEVTVPGSSIRTHRHNVTYKGTEADLDRMAGIPAQGTYGG